MTRPAIRVVSNRPQRSCIELGFCDARPGCPGCNWPTKPPVVLGGLTPTPEQAVAITRYVRPSRLSRWLARLARLASGLAALPR